MTPHAIITAVFIAALVALGWLAIDVDLSRDAATRDTLDRLASEPTTRATAILQGPQ